MKQHPYCYPGTDVYINKEDIRDKDDLESFERAHSSWRLLTLPRDLPITPEGYREIHRYMLQDVYDWAGQDRWVDTGRGAAPFCLAAFIDVELSKRFAAINAEDNLRGLSPDQFASRAAGHINELNAIHPFLDGNGRTQRAFLEILGEQAGHEIDLARVNPDAWNKASIQGFYKQNSEPMAEVIAGAIVARQLDQSPATGVETGQMTSGEDAASDYIRERLAEEADRDSANRGGQPDKETGSARDKGRDR